MYKSWFIFILDVDGSLDFSFSLGEGICSVVGGRGFGGFIV